MMRILGSAFAAVFLAMTCWLSYVVSDRASPVTDARVTIDPPAIMRGEAMRINVSVFYRLSCTAYIRRALYDSRGERYAMPELVLPPGEPGLQHSVSTTLVAPDFAVGEGRYVSWPSYGCNWFQRLFWPIVIPERYAAFEVVQRQ